jgi:hypothetical protein
MEMYRYTVHYVLTHAVVTVSVESDVNPEELEEVYYYNHMSVQTGREVIEALGTEAALLSGVSVEEAQEVTIEYENEVL